MLLLISTGLPTPRETRFLSTVLEAPAFRFQSLSDFSMESAKRARSVPIKQSLV
jgi:hypothetical protein